MKIDVEKKLKLAVNKATELYWNGSVFIYPTDTIYGFGGNPFNDDTVSKIDEIKGRVDRKRYIYLISSVDVLRKYVSLSSENHIDFLISIWPNPVSVVLKLNRKTSELFGSDTGAFRIPNNRFCLKLLKKIDSPLISTSVNKSGEEPLNEPSVIIENYSELVSGIFFSEQKSFCQASTLIDLTEDEPKVLREGKIKMVELLEKLG